ncbi:hypothetical protein cce_4920 [Crocosphaera subtropica ATCC 51142]|uniref:Uncharacterized protein n=1 Tax=Crocosphaera subtropica (strain ATCC 51142 / BH68) TaxID=43989 RepID=B1X2A5_CROS5|nr:hypothetical protein cce_4920 [Crocosphaera subtropica ATCC 51142]
MSFFQTQNNVGQFCRSLNSSEAREASATESQKIYETILLSLDQEVREENNLN